MGALDARLAVAHHQMAKMFGKLSGFLLAVDEVYCDGDKTIIGDETDDAEAEKFRPSRDINGAWVAECTYGLSAGSDPANAELRLHMHMNGRLISRETARQELAFLDDPDGEPLKQFREAMQDALITGILAMAGQGDPTLSAKALSLMRKDDLDFEDVLDKLVEVVATPPEAAPGAEGGPPGALDAIQGAESMARGGIPGQAEQAPQPSLPPLGQIMGNPNQVI
jgi:hypothetical protein